LLVFGVDWQQQRNGKMPSALLLSVGVLAVALVLIPLTLRHAPPLNSIKTGDVWHNWVGTIRATPKYVWF
jgi:hypothetical protein